MTMDKTVLIDGATVRAYGRKRRPPKYYSEASASKTIVVTHNCQSIEVELRAHSVKCLRAWAKKKPWIYLLKADEQLGFPVAARIVCAVQPSGRYAFFESWDSPVAA
jgi:hypothetical protein